VNHIANEYAFSPMETKPAEKIAFGEMRVSCGFSTEREEPILNDDEEDEPCKCINARRKSVIDKAILVLSARSPEYSCWKFIHFTLYIHFFFAGTV